jgi:putative protein-disulfide isomerase
MKTPSTLIYVMDPLCTRSYAQTPEILRLRELVDFPLEIEVIAGGMYREDTAGAVAPALAEALRGDLPRLSQYTGQIFGSAYVQALRSGTLYLDSLPACRAVAVARGNHPERLADFVQAVQDEIFLGGADVRDPEVYSRAAQSMGWNVQEFLERWQHSTSEEAAREDFAITEKWQITAYPQVLLPHEGDLIQLSRGWTKAEDLAERLLRYRGD